MEDAEHEVDELLVEGQVVTVLLIEQVDCRLGNAFRQIESRGTAAQKGQNEHSERQADQGHGAVQQSLSKKRPHGGLPLRYWVRKSRGGAGARRREAQLVRSIGRSLAHDSVRSACSFGTTPAGQEGLSGRRGSHRTVRTPGWRPVVALKHCAPQTPRLRSG